MKMKSLWLATALFVSFTARAEVFTLPQMTPAQTEPVFNTLGSMLFFKPVEPARGYGKIWGLGIGIAANATSSSAISTVVSGMSASFIPAGDINAGVTLPMGITVEGGLLPTFSYQGSSFGKTAIGAKLHLNAVFLKSFPLDVAFRVGWTKGTLLYAQGSGGTQVNVDYSTSAVTANLIVSKNFIVLEPFAGLGMVSHSSTLVGTGSGTIFGTGFPPSTTTYSVNAVHLWMHAGLLLNLQVLRISASVDYAFGLVSGNGKIAISI